MLEDHYGLVQYTILAASENQTTESTTISESSGPCSTGGKCVKHPEMLLLVEEVKILIVKITRFQTISSK